MPNKKNKKRKKTTGIKVPKLKKYSKGKGSWKSKNK